MAGKRRAARAIKKIKSRSGAVAKKPITSRQRVARRKNIAIARQHKKKIAKAPKKTATDARKASASVVKKVSKAAKRQSDARSAFAGKYKGIVKSHRGIQIDKSYAIREGHIAAIRASRSGGVKMAKKYAIKTGMKMGMTRKESLNFSGGYVRSLVRFVKTGR